MPAGRPPTGPKLVEALPGEPRAKERLTAILESLAGDLPISAACERLGVSEARFHVIRREALSAALGELEPKPLGRPRAPGPSEEQERIQALEAQVRQLETELAASRVREELAAAFPSLKKSELAEETRRRRRRRRRAKRQQ